MEKRDIYEHLARIYLDGTSVKSGAKKKGKSRDVRQYLFFALLAIPFIVLLVSAIPYRHREISRREMSLVLSTEPLKISLPLNSAKKQIYSFDLKKLSVARYKSIAFALKKSRESDKLAVRVEFNNAYKERSEVYLYDISSKWQEYHLNLSDFGKITDWTEMESVSFILEEWNSKDGRGHLYVDNVRFLN